MIRRTLQGGLLAAVAMFALVPTAAVAVGGDPAGTAAVVTTAPHRPHAPLSALTRRTPVRHCGHRSVRCHHHVRHARHAARSAYHRHTVRVAGSVATRRAPLNVRSGPGTGYRVVGHRHAHGRLVLVCKKQGSYVHGNPRWYKLADGKGYVSAHYVRTRGALPWC
ncbi:SH3 domain-containing protein [Streptomyces sp. TP-A0356]|uniref:SH3 domain-containing protein n=1 Tax=Streptomyces sp. TP-A0356 TaxID=1359208 RepID=UPI000ABB85A1|nr:SH3 domain-containing protein [Streptomyces sp. TP-A0356]